MKLPLLVLSLILLPSSILFSQSAEDIIPDLTPSEQADIRKTFGTFTSAVTVFTARNSAATGSIDFDNSDADLKIYNLPFSHTTGTKDDAMRFVLRGAIGHLEVESTESAFSDIYSQFESELPLELQGLPNLPDKQEDRATSLTLGGGVKYSADKQLTIEPAMDFIWTHVKRKYEYNNFVSALYGTKFDRDVFNNSTESITYAPSIKVNYDIPAGHTTITPSVLYTHLWTKDLWSNSRYGEFSIDSGVLRTQVIFDIPIGKTVFNSDTDLRPLLRYTKLNGAVKESLGDDDFSEYGATFGFAVKNNYISELSLGASYIHGSNFDGYRLDLGFELL